MTLERLWQRIAMMIGRGESAVVDDSKYVQTMQVRFGPLEVRDNTPRVPEYGFASHPPSGTDCVVVFAAGDRNSGVVIATNHKDSRLKGLAEGEVAIYNKFGAKVVLKANGDIVATSPTKLIVEAPLAKFTGNVEVDGATGITVATGDVVASGKSLKTHVHSGVTAGVANTGPPV